MKKFIITITVLLAIILSTHKASASENVARTSAKLSIPNNSQVSALDARVIALRKVFQKYNSPLIGESEAFVKYADEYNVDWRLLPAISGLESSFGVHLMPGSFNAYGWGGGHIYFESWKDGIKVINKALRANYMDKWGATDVWSIGPIYAESKTWSVRVNSFMQEINREYLKLSVFSVLPNI